MLAISQAIAVILLFAILIQFCVDVIKGIVGEKVMGFIKPPIWSLVLGVAFAFMFSLDFFAMFGYISSIPIASTILTGLIMSAGAVPIHELLAKLRESRIQEESYHE